MGDNQADSQNIKAPLNTDGLSTLNEATATEILGLILAPPITNRRIKLVTDIGQMLKDLEKENKIRLEDLLANDQFIDTVFQATSFALKTSEEEKIKAFKNAILNSALGHAPDKTISQIYLNLVDNFTTWHIRILHLVNDPESWFRNHQRAFPNYMAAGLNAVIIDAYPALKGQSELLNLIWDDLKRAGLHNSGSLGTIMTGGGLLGSRTTDLGKKFLRFIEGK